MISIIKSIGSFVAEQIWQQCVYIVESDRNIKTLTDNVNSLEARRKEVQKDIHAAEMNGLCIREDVQYWVSGVDKVMPEVKKILEDDASADKRCFYKWFLNLALRRRLSMESEEKTKDVTKLKEDGKFNTVYSASTDPSKMIDSGSQGFIPFESTKAVMSLTMEALKDNKINFVGIYGMGGIGKTTLVKQIENRAKEEKLFDEVVMATVTQSIEVKNIQQQIIDTLCFTDFPGLTLSEKSEQGRADWLSHRMRRVSKILIILDNVWAQLDLKAIGIPFGIDHMGCKLVVTTRRKQACDAMLMRSETSKIIPVNVLSDQESWSLFKTNAGEVIESPILKPKAEETCRECGGLPIALVTVGRAMRGKHTLDDWIEAAMELQKSQPTNIEGMVDIVYKCLQSSIDYLRDAESRWIFLLCCLFPEGYDVSIETLVRYGFGLEMFNDVGTMQEARRRAHFVINNLKDSCLLLSSDKRECIKMHDVVRDVAKSIASDKYFVKAGVKLDKWPNVETLKHYTGISVMHNQIDKYPDAWDCSNLQILLTQNNYITQDMPEGVFKGMKTLKVLDQSSTFFPNTMFDWRRLESGFAYLTNLQTLIIKDCRIADSTALGKLKRLQILSLSTCEFQCPPVAIGELTNMRLLDLEGMTSPRFPPNLISRLSQLEELYMNGSLRDSGDLIITELESLSQLATLTLSITDFRCIPNGFKFPSKLDVFKVSTRPFILTEPNYLGLSGLVGGKPISAIPSLACVKPLLKKVNHLCLSSFEGLKNILPILSDRNSLAFLRSLEIDNCDEMENLINTEECENPPSAEPHQPTCFSHLENLVLSSLMSFEGLCNEALPSKLSLAFRKLQCLNFYKCSKLSSAFASLELLWQFDELEELAIDSCEALECVFNLKPEKPAIEEQEILSRLRELALTDLPELKQIWRGPTEKFRLRNLQIASISECKNLKVLFHVSIAQSLVQLKEVVVSACDELETLFANEMQMLGGDGKVSVTFPRLASVSLCYLPKLIGFCVDNLLPKWPCLVHVEVRQCPMLKTFATSMAVYGNQSTPNLKDIKLDGVVKNLKGKCLNTVLQSHYEHKMYAMERNEKNENEFLEILYERVRNDPKGSPSFQQSDWKDMDEELFLKTGIRYGTDRLIANYNRLRTKYNQFLELLSHADVTFDANSNTVSAVEDVWYMFFKKHMNFKTFRSHGCKNYEMLGLVFDKMWKEKNENVFLEILYERVRKDPDGSPSFIQGDWQDMDEELFSTTSIRCGANRLITNHNRLHLKYCQFTELLNHTDVTFDTNSYEVYAPSDIWEIFCKKHMNFKIFQRYGCMNYEMLCQVFDEMWKEKNENVFLEILYERVKEDSNGLPHFTQSDWHDISEELFSRTEIRCEIKRLRANYNRLHMKYCQFSELLNYTDVIFDTNSNTVFASKDVWEMFMEKHMNFKTFKRHGCKNYEMLARVFMKSTATSLRPRASTQLSPTSSGEAQNEEEFFNSGVYK